MTLVSWACAAAATLLSILSSTIEYDFSPEQTGFTFGAAVAACFLFEYIVLGGESNREAKIRELKEHGVLISTRRRYVVLIANALVFFLGSFVLFLAWRFKS